MCAEMFESDDEKGASERARMSEEVCEREREREPLGCVWRGDKSQQLGWQSKKNNNAKAHTHTKMDRD